MTPTTKWMAGLLWAVASSALAAEPAAFRYAKAIEKTASAQDEILAALLDSQVYATSRDGFPDLRVLDEHGVETPYLLEKVQETRNETTRDWRKGEVISLENTHGNRLEIRLRLDQDAPTADGLSVDTPLKNYEHQVTVFGSQDGQNWSPLVVNAAIFDYSRHMDVSNRDVPLPPNSYRQLKVIIEEAVQTREPEFLELTRRMRQGAETERRERTDIQRVPLRIDRIEWWHNVTKPLRTAERKFDYPVVSFAAQTDTDTHSTIVTVQTRREPFTGLSLQTANRNFSRPAAVQIPLREGVQTRWREIGGATIQSLRFRDIDREQLTIAFPEQRQETYRIVIRNDDNPPLDITGIRAQGNGYRLVFLAAPGKTYRLHYGADELEAPRYDTARVLDTLRTGYQPVEARLGGEIAAAAVSEAPFDFARLLNSKLFLGAVVVLMVIVLTRALFAAGKRIEDRD